MDWTMISLAGIILGIGIFIFLQTKSTFLIVSTFLGALTMAIASGMPLEVSILDHWVSGFAGFMKNSFLIFALSALFGKIYYMGGGARRTALAISKLCSLSKKNIKYFSILFVVVVYNILNYVGLSGMVMLFCVYGIAKELYMKNDIPWRFYAFGGASINIALILGGNLTVMNVAAGKICGDGLAGNMPMSILLALVHLVLILICIRVILKRSEKKGEGFMETGEEIARAEIVEGDKLPSLAAAIAPLVLVIVLSSVFRLHAAIAMFCAVVLCFVLYRNNYTDPKSILQQGLSNGMITACGVGAISAMIALMKAAPGYTVILDSMDGLPPLIRGVALTAVICTISAAPPSTVNTMGPDAFATFSSIGLSPATAHTLMNTTWWGNLLPWGAGTANCVVVAKIKFNKCMPVYFVGVCCYFATMVLAILLVQFGVFV